MKGSRSISNKNMLTPEFSILVGLRKLGVKHFVISWDFFLAIITSLIIGIVAGILYNSDLFRTIAIAYLTLAITLIGIIVAGISVVASIADEKFAIFLSRIISFVEEFLIHFVYSAIMVMLSIGISVVGVIIETKIRDSRLFATFLFSIISFFFFYALFTMFFLVDGIRKLFLYRIKFHNLSSIEDEEIDAE